MPGSTDYWNTHSGQSGGATPSRFDMKGRTARKSPGRGSREDQAQSAMDDLNRRGTDFQDEYESWSRGYDPRDSEQTWAPALYSQFEEGMGIQLDQLAGDAVRGNRLDTGFYTEDQHQLYKYGLQDLNRTLAANRIQTEQLFMQHKTGQGAYGMENSGRYLDMLAGERDRELLQKQIDAKNTSSWLGALGTLGGAAIGFAAGGPPGAAAGASIGSSATAGLG